MWILLTSGKLVNTNELAQVQRDRDTDGEENPKEILVLRTNGNLARYSGQDALEIYDTIAGEAKGVDNG